VEVEVEVYFEVEMMKVQVEVGPRFPTLSYVGLVGLVVLVVLVYLVLMVLVLWSRRQRHPGHLLLTVSYQSLNVSKPVMQQALPRVALPRDLLRLEVLRQD
jgi:hypothetical protein